MTATGPTLFTGRFVRTDHDPADPASLAEAMLVEGGKIISIGSRQDVTAPRGAAVVDLGEGWAMPCRGFAPRESRRSA